MYSIMIVDDEAIIRKGLTNFIPWNTIHCEIICEATNGLEAKDLLTTFQPDIIISDIKMPGMDGIDLSKYIYETYPHIKVIILTGYSDFVYAQSAIKYNVVDFVLKPSSNTHIIQAVNVAIRRIHEEQAQLQELKTIKGKLTENLGLLQEKFFYDLIHGLSHNPAVLEKSMTDLNIVLNRFHIMLFKIISGTNTQAQHINGKTILNQAKTFISTLFKEFTHYTITINSDTLSVIINVPETLDDATTLFINRTKEMLDFFNDFMHISIFLGMSNTHQNFENIYTAYKEASESLSFCFYEDSHIVTYTDCKSASAPPAYTPQSNHIDRILLSMTSNHPEEAVDRMKYLVYELKEARQPIEHIKNLSILIASLAYKHLMKHYINLSEVVENSYKTYAHILQCNSISDLTHILEEIILSSTDMLKTLNSQDNDMITQVTHYINTNLAQPISLNDLASLVHVNSSYLSRLIKQETGHTLTDIIAQKRIEKAKVLLSSSALKTYEVGINVGIDDPAYFSKVFKKHTGLSPSEYRRHVLPT